MELKIEEIKGYSPQIGHLISMMNYTRETTLDAVQGLQIDQLDYLPSQDSNSIGALLLHIAAVEIIFQIEVFEGRQLNDQEVEQWSAAFELGEEGRNEIKGNSLEFYLDKLTEIRNRTLEELKQKNDEWLYEERPWFGNTLNNYFVWFHVFEDELNHRGQIRILRKALPVFSEGLF